ncbi:hypothetical protein EYF80_026632 [Liparis tanakae]|uniref:Uncharacterized protein n=1 Tax=Liparis tanakae TaxID=230148 RepID=A0A4Z2HBB9_9TELE|nr:hypothetical protein EYF80_026632 [Liparis tanakae]
MHKQQQQDTHDNKTERPCVTARLCFELNANLGVLTCSHKQKVLRRAANRKEEVVLAVAFILKATAGCRLIRCVRSTYCLSRQSQKKTQQHRGSRTGPSSLSLMLHSGHFSASSSSSCPLSSTL